MTTDIHRGLPSTDAGSALPFDAIEWQNRAHKEISELWERAACFLTAVSGTNTIIAATDTAAANGPILGFARPMMFWLIPDATNTASVVITIDNIGPVAIVDEDGEALQAGALVEDRLHKLIFDGTALRLIGSGTGSGGFSTAPDIVFRDEKLTGTAAGTFTSGGFVTRLLNTSVRNTLAGSSLDTGTGQFTLQPGTYWLEWSAPGVIVNYHQTRLQNITDGSTVDTGTSELAGSADQVGTRSSGGVYFSISTAKVFEIQHKCQVTQATIGLGGPTSLGAAEIYAWVRAWKVGSLVSQTTGIPGGPIVIDYVFSTTTSDADPGNGKLRLNSATQNAATLAYIDLLSYQLVTMTDVIDNNFDASTNNVKGEWLLSLNGDPTKFLLFNVTLRTTASGYRKITIAITGYSSASPFVDGDLLVTQFTRTGDKGDTGNQGADGGDIPWLFDSSTTMADPGAGDLRFNNATLASVTAMAISGSSGASGNPSIQPWVLAWDDLGTATIRGYLVIRKTSAPQNFAIYKVTGTITDNTTWAQIAVTHISSAGSFSNTNGLSVQFTAAAADSGSEVLLSTQNLSGVAQIDVAANLDDTYDFYKLVLTGIKPATDDVELWLRVGTGAGPTYQTSGYRWGSSINFAGTSVDLGSASDAKMVLTAQASTVKLGNATGENFTGVIQFANPETSDFCEFIYDAQYSGAFPLSVRSNGGGRYDTAGAITALRIMASSGNISGRVSLYGVKKA